jgi:SNF family Na+-dependent transporter
VYASLLFCFTNETVIHCCHVAGAFLIPFFIMLVLCGVPLAYMEMAVGQCTQQGPTGAIRKLCPFFQGSLSNNIRMLKFLCPISFVLLLLLPPLVLPMT